MRPVYYPTLDAYYDPRLHSLQTGADSLLAASFRQTDDPQEEEEEIPDPGYVETLDVNEWRHSRGLPPLTRKGGATVTP